MTAEFLSCIALTNTCGASSNDNCCNSIKIVGGSYDRSYDVANDGNYGNASFSAILDSFRLDKYEVTVGRFRAFVNAGMGTQSRPPSSGSGAHASTVGSGWSTSWNANLATDTAALVSAVKCSAAFQTWTDAPAANERRPMNCITWYEAMGFCVWDGGYLPTEAEWNYAATGGDQQRAYPWSSPPGSLTLDSSYASYNDGTNCLGDGMAGCAVTDLVPVGTRTAGDGRWGQSDLAGNVLEWMLDWYAPYVNKCENCVNLTAAMAKVIRGGSFLKDPSILRTGYRGSFAPTSRSNGLGFRCARGTPVM